MIGSYRTVCVVICGVILLCGFGAHAYGAARCVTDELHDKKTAAYAMPDDVTIELQLRKEKDLIPISNPKEVLDDESALKENFLYKFPFSEYKGRYVLKKSLEVQANNGERYLLSPEKAFELEPLPSGNGTAIIPVGKRLIKKKGTAPHKYEFELAEDLTVNVTPPKDSLVTFQLYPQRIERIPGHGTSMMGTTLTVEPKKAPLGGYIKLTVKKMDFDFGKARFDVCVRLHGKDDPENKPFFDSDDVELQELKPGQAVLRARIPKKLDGLDGLYLAKPVDLLVVASIPGNRVKRAEAMTKEFSVSSQGLAGGIGILALIVPYLLTVFVAYRGRRNTLFAAQNDLNETKTELENAKKESASKEKIDELKKKLKEQEAALEKARSQSPLNPIWIVSGKVGSASLSLAQILLWSMLVFSASFYVLVVSGELLALTNDVLVLLGFAGSASVIAKITARVKEEKGQVVAGATEKEPKWLDLIRTEGRPDLYKVQMALFTTLAAVFVAGEIFSTLEFPILPSGLLTLIGISNGVYLTAKASSKTVFEELAELDRERQKANENLEKLKNEAAELDKSLTKAKADMEAAQQRQSDAETELENAKKTNAPKDKIDELDEALNEQKTAFEKAKAHHKEVLSAKGKADKAMTAAQKSSEDIQNYFEKKKKEALQ
jgi:Flp pilus assembly protein TadB